MLTEASTDDKEITIDDEMLADWKAIQEKHANPEEALAETPKEPVVEEKPDRTRDANGKFAKEPSEKPAKAEEKSQIGKAEQPAEIKPAEEEAPLNRDVNRPPSTWKPIERAEWDKLSPTVKAAIHRREENFQHGQSQLLPDANLGREMRKVAEPYRMVIESQYGSAERAMGAFLQTAAALQMGSPQQKLQTLVGIAQQFGVDLSPLASPGNPQPQQEQEFRDPRVDQLLQQQQRAEQQRQLAEQQQIEGVATGWSSEKDATGNPKRPYINDVMQEMATLIPQIRRANPQFTHVQVLDAAYDRAIWANPDVRTVLQGARATELEQQTQAENQQRVRDAKRAASVNVPRRASVPSPAKPGSIEETLKETARTLGLIT